MTEFSNIPVMQLRVKYLEKTVLNSVMLHEEEIKKDLELAVKNAIENFDFENEIKIMTDEILTKTIRNTVKWSVEHYISTMITPMIETTVKKQVENVIKTNNF